MGIEDHLDYASSPGLEREAEKLQERFMLNRGFKLREFYLQSLQGADKSKFASMSSDDQTKFLQDRHYKLPGEFADRFVTEMAIYTAKQHGNETVAKELDKQLKALKSATTDSAKRAAQRKINDFKPMLNAWGFHWDDLLKEGKEQGFSEQIFKQHANVGRGYMIAEQNAAFDVEGEEGVNKYLAKIKSDPKYKGFKSDIATGKEYHEKKAIALDHFRMNRSKDAAGFKDAYHHFF